MFSLTSRREHGKRKSAVFPLVILIFDLNRYRFVPGEMEQDDD
jgi:hypothetical protein